MAVFAFLRSTTVLVALLCDETGKAQSVVVTLSADGTRVPGGYAVPVGGDITFTCGYNGSFSRSLFWEVNIVNGTATTIPSTALFLGNEPGFSTTATGNTDNPVNVTIHNMQLVNNGSTVTCQLEKEGSPTIIIVEGVPSCPILNISSLTVTAEVSSLAVTLSAADLPWLLPVRFNVTVSSGDIHTWSTSFNTKVANFNVALKPNTVYNISVIPCNSVGCNEGCPAAAYTFTTTTTAPTTAATSRGNLPLWAIIVIPLVVLLALIAAIIVVAVVVKLYSKDKLCNGGAKEKHGKEEQGVYEGGGIGGMVLNEQAISPVEEVMEPVELDANPAYISLHYTYSCSS